MWTFTAVAFRQNISILGGIIFSTVFFIAKIWKPGPGPETRIPGPAPGLQFFCVVRPVFLMASKTYNRRTYMNEYCWVNAISTGVGKKRESWTI